jgi:hypothetical protein
MANRKKKPNLYSQQKLAAAQHRNDFIRKLRYLVTAVSGDSNLFRLVPDDVLNMIYENRARSIRIAAAKGSSLPSSDFAVLKDLLVTILRTVNLRYTKDGPLIAIDTYFSVGLSLQGFLNNLDDNFFPAASLFKEKLGAITQKDAENETDVIWENLEAHLDYIISIVTLFFNDFKGMVYWIDKENVSEKSDSSDFFFQLLINNYCPIKIPVRKDGKSRPAFEVCWGYSNQGLFRLSFEPRQLGLTAQLDSASLPVYIQSHALDRLRERIDCVAEFILLTNIFSSLSLCSFYRGPNDTYHFDYRLLDKKVGYLVGSIYQGIVLINTFLFITNNGTHEGDKLAQITKMQKMDKEYLAIDKLSAFYESDLLENPVVKQLFTDAGCVDIFEIDPAMLVKKEQDNKRPLAEKILSYLNYSGMNNNFEAD